MSKTFLGVILILLGIGSCIGTPMFLTGGADPQRILDEITDAFARDLAVFEPGQAPEVDVPQTGTYTLFVVSPRVVAAEEIEKGEPAVVEEPPVPPYRFVGPDGQTLPVEPLGETMTFPRDGDDLRTIGSATLSPGRWTVEGGESGADRRLAIGRFEFSEIMRTTLAAMGIGLLLAGAGIVLMLIGLLSGRREIRAEEG